MLTEGLGSPFLIREFVLLHSSLACTHIGKATRLPCNKMLRLFTRTFEFKITQFFALIYRLASAYMLHLCTFIAVL
uniref:Uncharacterized protein n=1 Tax=Anguilla anguilla TaxID=7936 RepID=A0A0E9P6P3_ANGAN